MRKEYGLFSLEEAAKYLHLYLTFDEEEARREVKKLVFSLMNRSGNEQFAVDEVRKRVGFAVHCCRDGWRPQNPVAFLRGCFRNQDYSKENWAKWLNKLIEKDKEIRAFRNELAAMESLRPSQVLSYPPGRRAFNLIWTPVKSKVLAQVEDDMMLLLDVYRPAALEGSTDGVTECVTPDDTPTAYIYNTSYSIQVNKEGTTSKALDSQLNLDLNDNNNSRDRLINNTSLPFKYGGSFLSSYLYCSANGIYLTDGTPLVEAKAKELLAELHDSWREKIAHFVAIYGPQNITRLRDAYPQPWERVDFSSLYFVEKFLTNYASLEMLERGKAREVLQLPAHLVSA